MTEAIDITDTLAAKADQLNAVDLIAGPMTATITDVRKVTGEQPLHLSLDCWPQPWKPCKNVRRMLGRVWGRNAAAWIGQRITLYNDPEVVYGGKKTGGIRFSHASGIKAAETITVQVSRGKWQEITIQPLQDAPQQNHEKSVSERVTAAVEFLSTCTGEQLNAKAEKLDSLWMQADEKQRQQIDEARQAAAKRLEA